MAERRSDWIIKIKKWKDAGFRVIETFHSVVQTRSLENLVRASVWNKKRERERENEKRKKKKRSRKKRSVSREYFFFVPFSCGVEGETNYFYIVEHSKPPPQRGGVGKKRCVQNGAHTVDEDRELEASLECRETIEISIPLIRGSRGFAVSAVEKKPLRSSANETHGWNPRGIGALQWRLKSRLIDAVRSNASPINNLFI